MDETQLSGKSGHQTPGCDVIVTFFEWLHTVDVRHLKCSCLNLNDLQQRLPGLLRIPFLESQIHRAVHLFIIVYRVVQTSLPFVQAVIKLLMCLKFISILLFI